MRSVKQSRISCCCTFLRKRLGDLKRTIPRGLGVDSELSIYFFELSSKLI